MEVGSRVRALARALGVVWVLVLTSVARHVEAVTMDGLPTFRKTLGLTSDSTLLRRLQGEITSIHNFMTTSTTVTFYAERNIANRASAKPVINRDSHTTAYSRRLSSDSIFLRRLKGETTSIQSFMTTPTTFTHFPDRTNTHNPSVKPTVNSYRPKSPGALESTPTSKVFHSESEKNDKQLRKVELTRLKSVFVLLVKRMKDSERSQTLEQRDENEKDIGTMTERKEGVRKEVEKGKDSESLKNLGERDDNEKDLIINTEKEVDENDREEKAREERQRVEEKGRDSESRKTLGEKDENEKEMNAHTERGERGRLGAGTRMGRGRGRGLQAASHMSDAQLVKLLHELEHVQHVHYEHTHITIGIADTCCIVG